jgi:hypothetical protein
MFNLLHAVFFIPCVFFFFVCGLRLSFCFLCPGGDYDEGMRQDETG